MVRGHKARIAADGLGKVGHRLVELVKFFIDLAAPKVQVGVLRKGLDQVVDVAEGFVESMEVPVGEAARYEVMFWGSSRIASLASLTAFS